MKSMHRKEDRIEHIRPYGEEEGGVYDFSEGGIGLFRDTTMEEGRKCNLKIFVGDLNVTLEANVAHCAAFGRKYRVGFKYLKTTCGDNTSLREMVDRHSRGVPVIVDISQ